MKPIAGIVAPATSIAETIRRVHLAHIKFQDAERTEHAAVKQADKSRDAATRARLEPASDDVEVALHAPEETK